MTEFKLGQTIETNTHRKGLVRYVGEIHVAEGLWLGIELPTATGKNDGSVRGERYFDCPENHGLFVKETDILRIVSQPAPPKPRPSSVTKPTTPRPASTTRPASVTKPAPKPTPAATTASKPKPAPSTVRPRPSSVVAPKTTPKPAVQSKRLSVAPSTTYGGVRGSSRKSSIGGSSTASASDPFTSKPAPTTTRTTASSAASQGTSKAARDPNAEALQTKIRHLEKQHTEDQELLKELNQAKEERDRFHGIIQKLQTKYQTQHQESLELKESQKILQSENDNLSRAQQEHETELELALLDKEMAEERYEQASADAESLKARLEERELELDILRSEAELYTAEMSEEEKQAAGYYRLQHENDRLREALLLLKEYKEEIELDHKARIEELESDLAEFEKLREQYAELEQKNIKNEATIEHLQGQLDSANESEEIIEELSGQNQEFREQIAEKDMAIKDLESLKELNDELEIQHIEQANELRAELESRDVELYEQTKQMMQQETALANQETLINKFRDLVLDLESKMTDAESSKTMSEAQMKDATGRFNEVMELNRRLRTANTNTTIKTITSELRQLQASEAKEELEIIKHYLSTPEMHNSDSLRAYFASKRISFKSGLLRSILNSTDRQIGYGEGAEEALNNLLRMESVLHLAKLQHRSHPIAATIASSTLAEFGALGPVFHELATVEKTLDRSLDTLKADEVHYADFTESLRRSATLLSSVATDYQETLATQPEDTTIFHVCSIKAGLEYLISTFEVVNLALRTLEAADPDLTNDTQSIVQRLSKPSSICKESILAANKLLQTLNNLKGDSLYPQLPNGLDEVVEENGSVSRIAEGTQTFARRLVDIVSKFANQENGPSTPDDALMEINNLQEQYFVDSKIWELDGVASKIGSWNEHASVLNNNVEIEHGPAPWIAKAKEMEEAKKRSVEAEIMFEKLKSEHHATVLQIREREEIIDTKDLEIEHLRAKHREAAAKVVDMERLSTELTKSEEETMRLQKDLRNHQMEIRRLEERAAHSEQLEPAEAQPATPSRDAAPAAERALPQQNTPASFPILVQALSTENRWLRQREHSERFGDNMTAMFTRMHKEQTLQAKREMRHKQKWADEMLDMCMTLELSDDEGLVMESQEAGLDATAMKSTKRSRMAPVTLTPLKMPLSWRSLSSTPAFRITGLEDLGFADLSPVVEAFDSEIMDAFEGLSEFGHGNMTDGETLEGFSESSELTSHA